MFNSVRPHGLQHVRLPCPSPSPGVCSNSCQAPRVCSNWVGDAIRPSHPPSPPSPLALNFFPASLESDQNFVSALLFYLMSVWLNHLTHSLSLAEPLSLSHVCSHVWRGGQCLLRAPLFPPSQLSTGRPLGDVLPGSRGAVRCWSSMHPNRRPHSLQLQAPRPHLLSTPPLVNATGSWQRMLPPRRLEAVTSLGYKLSLKKKQNVFANKSRVQNTFNELNCSGQFGAFFFNTVYFILRIDN